MNEENKGSLATQAQEQEPVQLSGITETRALKKPAQNQAHVLIKGPVGTLSCPRLSLTSVNWN